MVVFVVFLKEKRGRRKSSLSVSREQEEDGRAVGVGV
jgi:hypothetical protein